jgi:hypothetical protein
MTFNWSVVSLNPRRGRVRGFLMRRSISLEQISDKTRVRITALELARLESLTEVYLAKGLAGDRVAGSLAVELSERKCALIGCDFRHQDPIQLNLSVKPQPSSVDKIMEALDRIAQSHGSLTDGNGNGSTV